MLDNGATDCQVDETSEEVCGSGYNSVAYTVNLIWQDECHTRDNLDRTIEQAT